MMRNYDNTAIPLTVTVADNKITIVPNEVLANGALFKLNFAATIKSTEGRSSYCS